MLDNRRFLWIAVVVALAHLCGIAWMEKRQLTMQAIPRSKRLAVKSVRLVPEERKEHARAVQPVLKQKQEKQTAAKTDTAQKTKGKSKEKSGRRADLIAQAGKRLKQIGKISREIDDAAEFASLQIDALEGGVEEHGYYGLLAASLREHLRLPELGGVKIELCIDCQGAVSRMKVIAAESKNNQRYVEKALPQLQFPPFGRAFQKEKEHTFTITLANDL